LFSGFEVILANRLWITAVCLSLAVSIGPVDVQAQLTSSASALGSQGNMILAGLELALPMFVEAFDTRLSRYLEVVGQRSISRTFSENDLYSVLLNKVQSEYPGAIREPTIKIRPDGFSGEIRLSFGGVNARLKGRIWLSPASGRLHITLHELEIDDAVVPRDLLRVMERDVNQMIDSQRLTLKVVEFWMREGVVWISVEVRR